MAREKTFYDYRGFDGVDIDLFTSLYDYGLIWKRQWDKETKKWGYKFIYGVSTEVINHDVLYYEFDYGFVSEDVDRKSEWNFADFKAVANWAGMTESELLEEPLPLFVYDMIGYYGYEEIFGSSYYPFEIKIKQNKV